MLTPNPLPPTLVLGDEGLIKRAVRLLALPLTVAVINSPEDFQFTPNTINVISLSRLPEDLPFGQLDARAGKAAFDYIRAGIDLALQKRIRAVVTAPINKEALRLAGIHYPGHTEILADFSGTKDFAMMLMNNDLRVILVTIHVSLREAIEQLTIERELTDHPAGAAGDDPIGHRPASNCGGGIKSSRGRARSLWLRR